MFCRLSRTKQGLITNTRTMTDWLLRYNTQQWHFVLQILLTGGGVLFGWLCAEDGCVHWEGAMM